MYRTTSIAAALLGVAAVAGAQPSHPMSDFMANEQFLGDERAPRIRTSSGEVFALMAAPQSAEDASTTGASDGSTAAPVPCAIPMCVDLRGRQTPVRNQGDRETCLAHAFVAALEVFPEVPDDLSEQDAHWRFMYDGRADDAPRDAVRENRGFFADLACRILSAGGVCEESASPYVPRWADLGVRDEVRRPEAAAGPQHGGGAGGFVYRRGVSLQEVQRALAAGHEVVGTFRAAWDEAEVATRNGLMDVVTRNPIRESKETTIHLGHGYHALLIVGYDNALRQLTVKNSWGEGWGDGGYGHMTYEYAYSYLANAAWITTVRTEPGAGTASTSQGSVFLLGI